MTLRELWSMAHGRRREMRTHAVAQAMLVWSLSEMDEYCVFNYLRYGELQISDGRIPYVPGVDEKIAEIYANNGKLIVG